MKINAQIIFIFALILLLAADLSYATYHDAPPPLPPPLPQPEPNVACSPAFQSAATGQQAEISATGGSGSYTWSAPGGTPSTGSGSDFSTSYSVSGIKRVVVASAGKYVTCTVNVTAPAQTPPATQPPGDDTPPPLPGTQQRLADSELLRITSNLEEIELRMDQLVRKADAVSEFFKKTGNLDASSRYSTASDIFLQISQNARETSAFVSARRGDASAARQAVQDFVGFVKVKIDEAKDALTERVVETKPCVPTGCSGEVCSDEDIVTTCEFREDYLCFRTAKCERQRSGRCGWTQTPGLNACLDQYVAEKSVTIAEGKTQTVSLAGKAYVMTLNLIVSVDKILLTVNGATASFVHSEPRQILDITVRVDDISLTAAGKTAVVAISVPR